MDKFPGEPNSPEVEQNKIENLQSIKFIEYVAFITKSIYTKKI